MKSSDLGNDFRKSPYIKRFLVIACVAPVIIVFSAIALSIYYLDWTHFSRAGSLITLVGIYIAYNDLSGKIYQKYSNDGFSMSEYLEIGDLSGFGKEELDELAKQAKEVEETRKLNRSFSNYVSDIFFKIEASLIVVGTLVSGYGDIVLKAVAPFNA